MTDWPRYSYQPGRKKEETVPPEKAVPSSSGTSSVPMASLDSEEEMGADFADDRVHEAIENLETTVRLNLQEIHSLMGRLLSHSDEYDIGEKARQLVSDAYLRLSSADTDLVKVIRRLGGKSCGVSDSGILKTDCVPCKREEVDSELTDYLSELDDSPQSSPPKRTSVGADSLRRR